MTRVYLVRHAEARGNIDRIFHGHTDSDVTENGERQLAALSEYFKDIRLDVLYSSDLKRAYQTACAVNRYHHLPIAKLRGLREINGGLWENEPWDALPEKFPEHYRTWEHEPHLHVMPEGESMAEVYRRMVETVAGIVSENKNRRIGIVSHGAAIRVFLCYVLDVELSELINMLWCENTAVTIIDFDDELKPHMVENGYCGHIGDELSTVRQQEWYRRLMGKED